MLLNHVLCITLDFPLLSCDNPLPFHEIYLVDLYRSIDKMSPFSDTDDNHDGNNDNG
jgi:hypothetical protein